MLKRIKISYIRLGFISYFGKATCILDFTSKQGESAYYLIKERTADDILSSLKSLVDSLPNNCVEIRLPKKRRKNTSALDISFWSTREGTWFTKEVQDSYRCEIDPITIEGFEKVLITRQNSELIVFDVGGGNGRVAKKIIEVATNSCMKINYILIEPNELQSLEAKTLLETFGQQATVICTTLDDFQKLPEYQEYLGKVDVVISSGGPLNVEVASYKNAIDNIQIINNLLKDDGHLIATGRTHLAIKQKEMKRYGFSILSTHVKRIKPHLEFNALRDYQQAYLIQKR